jgi:hypothetical protein
MGRSADVDERVNGCTAPNVSKILLNALHFVSVPTLKQYTPDNRQANFHRCNRKKETKINRIYILS